MFVNRCLRKILKLKWTDKIRNEQLWERTGQVPIQTEIGRRRWKWVGHTLRKGKNSITWQALQWNPQGSRGRGRPRETWRRCMEREMKDVGITWVALSKKAQDRDVWRMFVCGLYPDRGERQWWWIPIFAIQIHQNLFDNFSYESAMLASTNNCETGKLSSKSTKSVRNWSVNRWIIKIRHSGNHVVSTFVSFTIKESSSSKNNSDMEGRVMPC